MQQFQLSQTTLHDAEKGRNMNLPKPQINRETAMQLWIEEHSDYAKEQVVLNNIGMVGLAMKSLNLNPLDEDLFSIGLIGLVKTVNTFNPDKGVKFTAYATTIIRNEILRTFRKKRIIPAFSLDEPCCLDNGEEVSYADMIADGKRFEEDVIADSMYEEIMNLLSDREWEIISLRMDGKTQYEIAEICGISQSYASRIIKAAYKKCKKTLDMEE